MLHLYNNVSKINILLLGSLLLSLINALAPSTVVYGPGSSELVILTAKIAAREGVETFCITKAGSEKGCRKLMYGIDYSKAGIDEEGKAKPISEPEDMGTSLEKATCLILIADKEPIDEGTVNTLISNGGPNLSKVVLMSKIGITRAKGGFLGGGNDLKMLESEKALRSLAESKNLQFSIVRAGILKGGGPGEDGNDFGLSISYYNNLFDIIEAQVTMSHDRFSLGIDCCKGDPLDLPNAFFVMNTKNSFEPTPTDTNRISAATGCVAALLADEEMEFSVGCKKGSTPPSMEEWSETLSKL